MPTSRPRRSPTARIARPVAAMSTNASATWTATSAASAIAPSHPLVAVSVREARDAGRIPTASVTKTMRTTVNATTPASNPTSLRRGITVGVMSRSAGSPSATRAAPIAPPPSASSRLSASTTPGRICRRGENSGPLAQDRARAHQHRHAHTDKEQHHSDGQLRHRQRPAHPAESCLAPWRELDGPALVTVRELLRVLVECDLHRGLGLCHRDSRLQASRWREGCAVSPVRGPVRSRT